ncbi:hypothetical protein ACJMK2_003979 [Sinanodonta woodiana]|uniref:Uncharacterized protein n=1 Tax=Sinanodonta woodiana TaxID=1069815 RepID=A0ABD3Y2L3_SINWO
MANMNILIGFSVFIIGYSDGFIFSTSGARYAMYVWTYGFDISVPGCDENKFLTWDNHKNPECFTHTWDTKAKRDWLWSTCNMQGRNVNVIFLSDFHHVLKDAYNAGSCSGSSILNLRTAMAEGHEKVNGLKIYALFAVSDLQVSEQGLVKYVVYYNDHCAHSQAEKIDGVAINNEAYAGIKCTDDIPRKTYLTNLHNIKVEASKQVTGSLPVHYSISWHWGHCDTNVALENFTWNGKTANAAVHMIDIFDSIDVQVGYIIYPQISDRMKIAGYDYAGSVGKPIFATFYTEKDLPCQITFFPQSCTKGSHTESEMFRIFDQFDSHGIGNAKPCIHYFRGIYSSGANHNWPAHRG